MAGVVMISNGCRGEGGGKRAKRAMEEEEEERQGQLSMLALLIAAIRRSVVSSCRMERGGGEEVAPPAMALQHMDIGWPTDVRHVAHVTFDRFHGFLGLPVEFELEIPGRVPSASASVFGVSAESMQCTYDSKGNSVPTILLLMQERLYLQGGLKAEGIFRINPENGQEEEVRDQLNKGIVPDDIDVHCLAGLIKAWFRELPEGVLDGLSPEQVLQCNTEEECVQLVKLLLPTQAALLNWAIELMTDVVEEEEVNKMNARNIAMVFAPNMTQMSDPLTALMHAVQVMNLLKTLILKTLREREESGAGDYSSFSSSFTSDRHCYDEFDSNLEGSMSREPRVSMSDDDRGNYSQQEMDVNDEVKGHLLNDFDVKYDVGSEDEADSVRDIEECFLRQLEWKIENCRDLGGDCISPGFQETQLSSDYSAGSCFTISESKQGSSSTCDDTQSEASVNRMVTVTKHPLKEIEEGKELQMVLFK